MSMDYGAAYIGIKKKDGELKTYAYGYDNEIVPEIVLSSNWLTQFENASTREEALSRSFIDPWADDIGLKETIEDFDFDGYEIKDYKKFINSIKKIKASDIELVALGVVHGGRGYYEYDWRIINLESGQVDAKSWKRDDAPYNLPDEEIIEETINDWIKGKE